MAANDAKAKERQAAAWTVACWDRECHVKSRRCSHARRGDVTGQPRYRKDRPARSVIGCCGDAFGPGWMWLMRPSPDPKLLLGVEPDEEGADEGRDKDRLRNLER
jgi:hypothetical protein